MKTRVQDLDKAPRRRLDAGESGRMAGRMIGLVIRAERRRNRVFFGLLWAALIGHLLLGLL